MTSLSQDGMDKTITTGILQLCFAMLLVPVLDVFAKLLGRTLDPIQVTFMRFVMQILLLTPFVIWGRLWAIPKGTFRLQFARGILLAIATACFFAALQHLPLAEAITVLASDQSRRAAMGAAGRAAVIAGFDARQEAARMLRLLRDGPGGPVRPEPAP